jgi:26S proteasome regulatory subunit N1
MPKSTASTIAVTSDDPKKKKTEETEEKDKDKKEGSSKLKDGEKEGEEMVCSPLYNFQVYHSNTMV